MTANYQQKSGATNNLITIDSDLFGSNIRKNFFTQTPLTSYGFTYPPAYNTAYDHKCSLNYCTLLQDTSKTDSDNAHSLSSITTSPTFAAVDATKVALVDNFGSYELQIKTSHTAGFEYKGIYLECHAQKNGVNTAGDTGYPNNAYGIASVTNSQKRYAGPLRIK